MSRFDYIAYDENAAQNQANFKQICINLETAIDENLRAGRPKSLALTALEECYMWIGKQIRDDQIARNGEAKLLESRSNS